MCRAMASPRAPPEAGTEGSVERARERERESKMGRGRRSEGGRGALRRRREGGARWDAASVGSVRRGRQRSKGVHKHVDAASRTSMCGIVESCVEWSEHVHARAGYEKRKSIARVPWVRACQVCLCVYARVRRAVASFVRGVGHWGSSRRRRALVRPLALAAPLRVRPRSRGVRARALARRGRAARPAQHVSASLVTPRRAPAYRTYLICGRE